MRHCACTTGEHDRRRRRLLGLSTDVGCRVKPMVFRVAQSRTLPGMTVPPHRPRKTVRYLNAIYAVLKRRVNATVVIWYKPRGGRGTREYGRNAEIILYSNINAENRQNRITSKLSRNRKCERTRKTITWRAHFYYSKAFSPLLYSGCNKYYIRRISIIHVHVQ